MELVVNNEKRPRRCQHCGSGKQKTVMLNYNNGHEADICGECGTIFAERNTPAHLREG